MKKLKESGSSRDDQHVTLLQDDTGAFMVTARQGAESSTAVHQYKDRGEAMKAYQRLAGEPRPGDPTRIRDPYQGASERYAQILKESRGKPLPED